MPVEAGFAVGGTVEQLASEWRLAVEWHLAHSGAVRAAECLYVGRSISEAKKATVAVGGDLYVASAGFGLVRSDEPLPSYDVTVSDPSNALRHALSRCGATPSDWWMALRGSGLAKRSVTDLLEANPRSLLILALPSTYLNLLARDLGRLNQQDASRVRIVTAGAAFADLPDTLRASVLPYDERLESVPGWSGTQGDFAQRACRHFVEVLQAHPLSLDEACDRVSRYLELFQKPERISRMRANDEQIKREIRSNWARCGGRSARLLRYLRDDCGVACEQKRFQGLWRQVEVERDAKS